MNLNFIYVNKIVTALFNNKKNERNSYEKCEKMNTSMNDFIKHIIVFPQMLFIPNKSHKAK